MSVMIRMSRQGSKGNPFYRIVVADKSFARDGRFIEKIGTYDPNNKNGLVLVQFPWDSVNNTCRIRFMQPWAGAGFGVRNTAYHYGIFE